MPEYYSQGIENFLRIIWPYSNQGKAVFPKEVPYLCLKLGNQDPSDWFREVVRDHMDPSDPSCMVESNVAILASVNWGKGQHLRRANVHTFITDGFSIKTLAQDPGRVAKYFRLDVGPDHRIDPFIHSIAHIHTKNGPPRHCIPRDDENNVLIEYLDFLFRNFKEREWWQWVHRATSKWCRANSIAQLPVHTMQRIITSGNLGVIRDRYSTQMGLMHRMLRDVKCSMYPLRFRLSDLDRSLVTYPTL